MAHDMVSAVVDAIAGMMTTKYEVWTDEHAKESLMHAGYSEERASAIVSVARQQANRRLNNAS